ncbi:hypothetical protein EVAR_66014_1 [Eumeta japonica]|uniref:Uncharacterized protein n=1 Tax=Eumeta variegata TaxID=151549 RepID=A0A4C1Z5Y7_EUMVA|nr:hypothetical protein EVAR_66014_1 [Eumeta japonica]
MKRLLLPSAANFKEPLLLVSSWRDRRYRVANEVQTAPLMKSRETMGRAGRPLRRHYYGVALHSILIPCLPRLADVVTDVVSYLTALKNADAQPQRKID